MFLFVFALVSLFIPGFTALDRIFCLAGIAIFLGYTAYDTQKIKAYYNYYAGYPDMLEKASIFSALQLYLDFINLFLYLLRFLGKSGIERAAEQRERGPVSQTGPLFHFVHR